jgi:acyl-CoA dehydrogenase
MTAAGTSSVDALLVETVERLLTDTCTFEVVEQAEADGWCQPVWDALVDAGFPWVSIPEAAGGAGGSLADAMAVLRSVGRHAAPVPVAESGVLGGWLLAAAGFDLPPLPVTVVPDPGALRLADGRVQGDAVVAWGLRSARLVGLVREPDGWQIVSARPDQVAMAPGRNLAGEPRDAVHFDLPLADLDHVAAPGGVDGGGLRRRGALTRVVLMAGALDELCRLTVDYAHHRRQFGRPIAGFQAVQQHLVAIAQARVRATTAAELAVGAAVRGEDRFETAAAKSVADEAAVEATRAAHQAHGAMGVTREYRLHHLSRRLWAWRHEYGGRRAWARQLGTEVIAAGADQLFPSVTR